MDRIWSVIIFIFSALNIADSVFNYEIGARVDDKLSDFTYFISQTLKVPAMDVNFGLINFSNPIITCRNLFFTTKVTYSNEIANLYVGLEDGTFFDYTTLVGHPFGIAFGHTPYPGALYRIFYEVGKDGLPVTYIKNSTYNVRGRPWYKTAKSIKINYWTAPYIDAASGNPVVSLIYPILNYTLKGHYMAYAGSVAADVYLTQISAYLVKAYHDTDMNVFVVDQGTMSLLGNSLGAMTYVPGPGGTKVRY